MTRGRAAMAIAGVVALLVLAFLLFGGPTALLPAGPGSAAHVEDDEGASTIAGRGRGLDAGVGASTTDDAGVFPVARTLAPIRLSPARTAVDPTSTGVLEGRVVAWGTGSGIPGAELTFAAIGDGSAPETTSSVTSGPDGAFRFEPAASGAWSLALVTREGFTPFAPEWGHSAIRFVARPGARVTGVEVFLEREQTLDGRVEDEAGAPVAGAQVRVLAEGGGAHALVPSDAAATSDERGAFRIVAPDDAVLEASSEEHGRGRAVVGTSAQISHRITITLHPPDASMAGDVSLAGRVIDRQGHPVSSALVRAEPMTEPRDPQRELHPPLQAVSAEDGTFEIRGADRGRYRLVARRDGHASASLGPVQAPATGLELVLDEGGSIVVHATDESGAPVVGLTATVERANGPIARSVVAIASSYDAQGEVEVRDLEAADYEVSASAPGLAPSAPTPASVREGSSTRIDIVLRRGAAIVGRVTRDDGSPIVAARVAVEDRSGESSPVPISASTTTGEDGRFELAGLSSGLRSIVVLAEGHHGRIRSGIAVPDAGEIDAGEISLSPLAEGEEPTLELAGIGAVLSVEGDVLVVNAVLPGGGAAEAGIGPGDAVLAIDGVLVTTLRFEGSIERIRGVEGTFVHLLLRRGEEQVDLDVPRRRVRR